MFQNSPVNHHQNPGKSSGIIRRSMRLTRVLAVGWLAMVGMATAQTYLDNETLYQNQDPDTESRRSDHFRVTFGHYNWDSAGMSEAMAQGNLQMFEQMWNRWVVELGMHDLNESVTHPDGNKYRTNFNFLMTRNDGGGGGAWSSVDANGFGYAMANPGYCRWDPPSGATPHEMGHAWEGTTGGFNGSDSSGAWWECTGNWMQLQFLNSYPQAGGVIWNSMYHPCHGRNYYDSWTIYETARENPAFGAAWVNRLWTDYTADQALHEYILDRMLRIDNGTGAADRPGAVKDLWGDMAKKCVTWDFERQRWLAQANSAEDGSDWYWYQRCRTPLVKMAGKPGWYRPERSHLPQEYGFNIIPLSASAGVTVTCNFAPQSDPVRQSDWRACLVAVSNNGDTRYSSLWNTGSNSIALSTDETKLYLVVIAVPKPGKPADPAWQMYLSDAGLQFPYAVSFTNASPGNVVSPLPTGATWKTFTNADGTTCTHVQSTATVDSTAYVSPNAQVLGAAKVEGYARLEDYAVVRGNAVVKDYAVVSGHAMVQDNAQVYGNAKVRDWGRVFGYAEIYENARVIEHANCGDGNATTHTKVFGNAVIKGTTYVYDTSTFQGCLIMDGDSANGNGAVGSNGYTVADRGVHFGWQWGNNTAIFGQLTDNGSTYARHDFERDNPVFAMDKYGINHGFLMNGCMAGVDASRGGLVLPLDGTSQYVELHNSVNDFKGSTYAVWFKSSGGAADQRLWSLGDGGNKVMYLTHNTGGTLRFVITDGTTNQTLDSGVAIPANTWKHVAVVFSGTTCSLYLDGVAVASNAAMTLRPDSLNAPLMENANYLGRGNTGNYFQGAVDDFRVYNKSLSAAEITALFNEAAPAPVAITADSAAPTPNAATWLAPPTSSGDSSVTMSATPGTDASGWVEYYFTCVSGGGHDSGWVSFNKYIDVGITPGSSPVYTVKMRDRNGNTTAASESAAATLATSSAGTAGFSYGPIGIASGQIKMTATTVSSPSGKVEYKFDRTAPATASSGWQSSPTWTNTGLTSGTSYTYTVTVRDGRGDTSSPSAPASAAASDTAGPALPVAIAQWQMQPYPTVDNKVCMTAKPVTESGASVYYQCVSGGGPDSGWLAAASTSDGGKTYYAQWTSSSALPDGAYTYRYKIKDAAGNESAYSTQYGATITPKTGYHSYSLSQVATLADDSLVSFSGAIVQVNMNSYVVRDLSSGTSIAVKPNAGKSDGSNNEATIPANLFQNVTVSGHLYTLSGSRVVTYSNVTVTGAATTYTLSGKVTNSSGVAISGATVYFANAAAGTPVCTAVTDASGNYGRAVINGTWYVTSSADDYYLSAEQVVTVNGANAGNANFTLTIMPKISGTVATVGGTPVAGATVYFSRTAGASASPIYKATTDASGNYSRGVDAGGSWYVAASAAGYGPCADAVVASVAADVSGVNLVLTPGGDGLLGQYYDNKDFTNLMVTRIDPQVNFNWFGVAPDPLMGSSDYSVRWTGQIKPKYSETYTFYTNSDDGIRLWVNNKLVIDNWTNHNVTENLGSVTLTTGKWYPIMVEYYQGSGGAVATLEWSSPSQVRDAVPRSCLWSVSQLAFSISGKVTDLAGTAVSGALVAFSDTSGGAVMATATTDASGNYSQAITEGTWYASAIKTGYLTTEAQAVVVSGSAVGNVNFTLSTATPVVRDIPQTDQLIFGCVTESLPISGPSGAWACLYPAGSSLSATHGSPQSELINNIKWEKNSYAGMDGFVRKQYTSPIAINGASIVVAVKPVRNGKADAYTSIVNVFMSQLSLGVRNDSGLICVHRNGSLANNTTPIPDGQVTILSLIVQPNGSYKVYANGVVVMTGAASGTFTSLTPGSYYWEQYVDLGRNQADGWSTFNGYIGDAFLYKIALSDTERLALETDITNKLAGNVTTHAIGASAGTGGTINPSGAVLVNAGASKTFTITPDPGYLISQVTVDGVSQGVLSSYTFSNVQADHTIRATFALIPTPTVILTRHSATSSTSTYGELLSFDVTVNGTPAPTGSVTLKDGGSNGTTLGSGTLAGSACTLATSALTVGNHDNIVAVYSGDSAYLTSTSAPLSTQTVNKATPVVTVTVGSYAYTGTPQGPDTATTGGSSGVLAFIYAGSGGTSYGPAATKPTGAGTYTVTATVAEDPNFSSASSSATPFTIFKATPTLSVTNSPVPYTGSAQAATVTGSVPGTAANVKYNGSATVPSASGTYAIAADFAPSDSANHNNLTGTPAGNFVISPPFTTTTGTATATPGSSMITVTMPYTDDFNANNTYTVEYKRTADTTWTTWVANAPHAASPYTTAITGLAPSTNHDVRVTYNDVDGVAGVNPQTLTATTGPPGITELSGWTNLYHGTTATGQGYPMTYPVPAGSGTNRMLVVAIAAPRTSTGTRTVAISYGEQPLSLVNGDMGNTSVYQHTALYYLNEAGLDAATSTTLSVTVSNGSSRVTDVFAAVYDGVDQTNPITDSKQYNSGTNIPSTFAFATGLVVNAGNQAIEITCSDRRTSTSLRTVSSYATNWSLATEQTWTTTDAVRNMVVKRSIPAANVTSDPLSTTMSGTSLVSMTAMSLAQAKVTPLLTLANPLVTYNGSTQAATVNGSTAGTVSNVKYNGSATVPTAAGTYDVTADFVPTDAVNYIGLTAASAGSFVIQKAAATVTLGNLTQTYDGTQKSASATTVPGGLTVGLTYNGSATPPSATGNYTVEATVTEANYTGTATDTLVIGEESIVTWRKVHFSPEEIADGLADDNIDADGDGRTNLLEFAFNGDPRDGASTGLLVTRLADGALAFTCAVRRGAAFTSDNGHARKSAVVDGLVYTIEGTSDLAGPWDGVVNDLGVSDTAPAGSGLPVLTTGWEYHTFSAFNGLSGKGFLRAGAAKP